MSRMRYLMVRRCACVMALVICGSLILSGLWQLTTNDTDMRHAIPMGERPVLHKSNLFSHGRFMGWGNKHQKNPTSTYDNQPALDTDKVALIMKTGHAVYRDRLIPQLETFASPHSGRNSKNTIILSDYADTLNGTDLVMHDVVGPLAHNPQVAANSKFITYKQKIDALKSGETLIDAVKPGTNNQGWIVDALKFIPGYKLAAETFPEAHWFVGIDDDTYVIWDNLLPFLAMIDHTKEHYLGTSAIMVANGVKFHHGGSIILISQAAMRKRFIEQAAGLDKFNVAALEQCCGDGVLAMAFSDVGIVPDDHYNWFFNSRRSEEIKVNQDNFCLPIFGVHHAVPQSMKTLWERFRTWEVAGMRKKGEVTTWMQLLRIIATDETSGKDSRLQVRSNWDFVRPGENDDKAPVAWSGEKTAEICEATCDAHPKRCLGWVFVESSQECWLTRTISPGTATPGSTSGLNLKRVKEMEDVCKTKDWRWEVRRHQPTIVGPFGAA